MKYLTLIPVLLASFNWGFAQTLFKVVSGHGDTRVQFVSEAPMETVTGTTRTATGFVEFEPASTGDGARGEIHVDLASLKTGIDLRDRHMRENHLETSKYPEAVFTLTRLTLPDGGLREGVRTQVGVQGTFTLHGVEKTIAPETYLTLRTAGSGSSLRVESDFTVKLSEYNIKRPQFLLMRLAEEQRVRIELHATSGTSVASGEK